MTRFNVASLIGSLASAVIHRNRVKDASAPGAGEAGGELASFAVLAVRHPGHNRSILRAMNTPSMGSRADGSNAFARRGS
jgi:hypothetical protein